MNGERAAVISVGTNSTRLLIARIEGRALVCEYHEARGTRLGEGLTPNAPLGAAAVERTLAAVADFAQLSRGVGRRYLIGTCALRDASDAARFASRAAELAGVPLEVLTGDQEARASFEGALFGLAAAGISADGPITVVDVGGGSVEFARRDAPESALATASLALGAVALTEKYLRGDPPSAQEVQRCREIVRLALSGLDDGSAPRGVIAAVGGTASAAVEMLQADWLDDVARIAREDLSDLTDLVVSVTVMQRRRMHGLPEQRADIIGAGLLVLDEVCRLARVRELLVARSDLLVGLLLSKRLP